MNKTTSFVIGIGSQRAGSTLLHRVLDECTNIFMHPIKELHYFDTLYDVRHQSVLTNYSQRLLGSEVDKIVNSGDLSFIKTKKYKCFLRANKILGSKKIVNVDYIDLYRPCLIDNKVVGEITPEYMILPEEGVEFMSKLLGGETPIILITRDPVDRFVSAFKLLKAYGRDKPDMSNFENDILEVFETMPTWVQQQKELNDYEKSKNKFKKHFKNFLVLDYRNLISNPCDVSQKLEELLCEQVDVSKYKDILQSKVNEIGETARLSGEARAVIAEKLKR